MKNYDFCLGRGKEEEEECRTGLHKFSKNVGATSKFWHQKCDMKQVTS
jgi:hypothetical protein